MYRLRSIVSSRLRPCEVTYARPNKTYCYNRRAMLGARGQYITANLKLCVFKLCPRIESTLNRPAARSTGSILRSTRTNDGRTVRGHAAVQAGQVTEERGAASPSRSLRRYRSVSSWMAVNTRAVYSTAQFCTRCLPNILYGIRYTIRVFSG